MPNNMLESMPWLIKFFALFIGGIISLVLSGDINIDDNDNATLKINMRVIIKLLCSIGLGLFIGEFIIDYFDYEHLNYYSQSAVLMAFSVFGMLIFGILYRSVQLTMSDKTLSQIVIEIKQTVKAFLK